MELRELGLDRWFADLSVARITAVDRSRYLVDAKVPPRHRIVNRPAMRFRRLPGDDGLETRAVSHTGEGRHTTTRRQLIALEQGGVLIDMPGMRELGMLAVGEGMDETFADIGELAKTCRFTDCSHAKEPVQNYLKLRKESEFHDLTYVERRKRDKAFGRLVHSAMKQKDRPELDRRHARTAGRPPCDLMLR